MERIRLAIDLALMFTCPGCSMRYCLRYRRPPVYFTCQNCWPEQDYTLEFDVNHDQPQGDTDHGEL